MSYFLFLLTTATLFIRPAEIVPDLYAWPIYNCMILGCLAASLPGVLKQLSRESLAANPTTACVLGLWFAVMMSDLAHFRTIEARYAGWEFAKIVIYFLLLRANLDSPQRLKSFLRWLLGLIAMIAVLSLLSCNHVFELPGVQFCEQGATDAATGQTIIIPRLQGTGIFSDPNDLAMILVAGVCLALSFAGRGGGFLRFLSLPLVGLFGYCVYATQSRGGLLAFMAALMVLFHARWGLKRTLVLGAVALPALLAAMHGRMTNFDEGMGQGTGQDRVQLWSLGLGALRHEPIFGVGEGKYLEVTAGLVAHNSFVHAYTELGLLGGTLFFGCFLAPLTMLYRLRRASREQGRSTEQGAGSTGRSTEQGAWSMGRSTEQGAWSMGRSTEQGAGSMGRSTEQGAGSTEDGALLPAPSSLLPAPCSPLPALLPYITAMLVGFAVSMFSLSRNYVVPTYLMFGLAAVYVHMAAAGSQVPLLRFDRAFVKRLAISSVCFLAAIYLFVRLGVHWH